jgi:hypothetical protein
MAEKGTLSHYDADLKTPMERLRTIGEVRGKTTQIVCRIDRR